MQRTACHKAHYHPWIATVKYMYGLLGVLCIEVNRSSLPSHYLLRLAAQCSTFP